jgi:hypothetical protein
MQSIVGVINSAFEGHETPMVRSRTSAEGVSFPLGGLPLEELAMVAGELVLPSIERAGTG